MSNDESGIYTREGKRGDVRVRLGFPTRMGAGAVERPFAALEVTDVLSGQIVVMAELSAEDFTGLMGGSAATVTADVLAPHPERIGKRSQNISTEIRRTSGGDLDEMAEGQRQAYLAEGWESVRINKTNYGRRVVAYRWIDDDDE